jgi:hypothetical protein
MRKNSEETKNNRGAKKYCRQSNQLTGKTYIGGDTQSQCNLEQNMGSRCYLFHGFTVYGQEKIIEK